MAVEGYRAPFTASATVGATDDHEANLFWLASFLSASASWDIIDSWTSTTYNAPDHTINGRYKGDPIADAQPAWADPSTLGNGWGFVVEMANPVGGRPPMQICFQWSRSNFAPVSGDSYDWDASNNDGWFYRFGTQGDWDTEATPPDFTDTGKASNILYSGWYHYGSGADNRLYCSADDGWLDVTLANADVKEWTSVMWFGRYNAKSTAQDTIANPAYAMVTNNNGQRLDPDAFGGGSFLVETPFTNQRIVCLDEQGVMRDWPYVVTPGLGNFLQWGSTVPNEFDTALSVDLYEVLVKARQTFGGYDDRLIGSLPGIYAASRLGPGAQFDGGNYLCLGTGYGVVIEWDGTAI